MVCYLLMFLLVSVIQFHSFTIQASCCITKAPGCYFKLKGKQKTNISGLYELGIQITLFESPRETKIGLKNRSVQDIRGNIGLGGRMRLLI